MTLPKIPRRSAEAHKGDFGHLLLVGGSRGMPGAISLSALAALRTGCGLATIATSRSAQPIVASFHPCLMTAPLTEDADGQIQLVSGEPLDRLIRRATCLAVGPGLGRSRSLTTLVEMLHAQTKHPAVFDADGLNALAERIIDLPPSPAPRVWTPHPGEWERLSLVPRVDRQNQEQAAIDFAARHQLIIVLKGPATLVTDGQRRFVNETGSPAMATAGCGDVLTGMIAALLAQSLAPFDAATLAVHLHGRAGDLAAAEIGPVGLTALDLIDRIPTVLRGHIA